MRKRYRTPSCEFINESSRLSQPVFHLNYRTQRMVCVTIFSFLPGMVHNQYQFRCIGEKLIYYIQGAYQNVLSGNPGQLDCICSKFLKGFCFDQIVMFIQITIFKILDYRSTRLWKNSVLYNDEHFGYITYQHGRIRRSRCVR